MYTDATAVTTTTTFAAFAYSKWMAENMFNISIYSQTKHNTLSEWASERVCGKQDCKSFLRR